jgi:hypothetical protein
VSKLAKLLEIQPHFPDRQVALMIAAAMLESDRQPYWFSINHDIRPPKCLACPVQYDWAIKDRVGIKTLARTRAEHWIAEAALRGYTVSREGGKPLACSIAIARRRAEYHQQPKLENDDDIPF